jgi:hypothetical protein
MTTVSECHSSIVMADRWDRKAHGEQAVEVLKERYYAIAEQLERVHGGATGAAAEASRKQWLYDGEHERRREEQLRRLYGRTEDQLEEGELLGRAEEENGRPAGGLGRLGRPKKAEDSE